MQFPAVTICESDIAKQENNVTVHPEGGNFTQRQIVQATLNSEVIPPENWTMEYTILGPCLTHRSSFSKVYGKHNGLIVYIRNGSFFNWEVWVHDDKESPVLSVAVEAITMQIKENLDLHLTRREYFRQPRSTNRICHLDPEYSDITCKTDFFNRKAIEMYGCSIYKNNIKSQGYPYCFEEPQRELHRLPILTSVMSTNWSGANCDCMHSCTDVTYIIDPTPTDAQPGESTSRLRVYYQKLTYFEVQEKPLYSGIQLACDIGGAVGLMLGISLATCTDYFLKLLQKWIEPSRKYGLLNFSQYPKKINVI